MPVAGPTPAQTGCAQRSPWPIKPEPRLWTSHTDKEEGAVAVAFCHVLPAPPSSSAAPYQGSAPAPQQGSAPAESRDVPGECYCPVPTTVDAFPSTTTVNSALSTVRPTARDSMLAPAQKYHSNRKSWNPRCLQSVKMAFICMERAGPWELPPTVLHVARPTGVGLTAARKDTGHTVDETWLIGHEDRDDVLLLALRKRLGLNHVHITTGLRGVGGVAVSERGIRYVQTASFDLICATYQVGGCRLGNLSLWK